MSASENFIDAKEPAMSSLSPLSLPTAAPTHGRALAGHWKLPAGRVLSLYPRERSVLEITLGRVWLTGADGPGPGADHVLAAGERLVVEPGRHVVIEPWAGAGWPAAAFRWDAAPAPHAVPLSAQWERGVALPLRDLSQALGCLGRAVAMAAGAAGRLFAGLARYALAPRVPQTGCGGG